MRARANSGWTTIEVLIASVLAVVVVGKVALVMDSSFDASAEQSADMFLDDKTEQVLDQIALAIMGSDRGTLLPTIDDVHSSGIKYKFSMGLEGGEVVWSDQEEIELEGAADVVWKANPDKDDERRAVWTGLVRPLLEGEIPNGVDDNGNGLIDENGLSFVLDGDSVLIRLTLEREDTDGRIVNRTVEARVTCRN